MPRRKIGWLSSTQTPGIPAPRTETLSMWWTVLVLDIFGPPDQDCQARWSSSRDSVLRGECLPCPRSSGTDSARSATIARLICPKRQPRTRARDAYEAEVAGGEPCGQIKSRPFACKKLVLGLGGPRW